jgi:hypothetical protein
MTTSDLAKLRTAAIDALRFNNGDIKKTAPKLARTLLENSKRPPLIVVEPVRRNSGVALAVCYTTLNMTNQSDFIRAE